MDAKRFDNWTRTRALRLSRRNALKAIGAGGAAAALLSAESDGVAQSSCNLTIHAETTAGPSAPASYDGVLTFSLDGSGGFSQASFTPSNATSQPASGQAIGRSIDFQVTLAGGQLLTFTGSGDTSFSSCQGAAGGLFIGTQPGDLGAWMATSGAGSSTFTAAVQSAGLGQAPGSSTSSSTSNSGNSCAPPLTPCGANCCPGGATCTDSNQGLCTCPPGTEQCGNSCVASCSDGQPIDFDSCTCPQAEAACIQNQQTCANHGQCCSGYCGGGTCFDCAGKVCGEFGCIDPSRDPQNCGNCGVTCIAPQVCANGVCGCGPDGTPCISGAECCSQLCFVGTCTTCSNVTTSGGDPLTFCGQDICVILDSDIDHCGACFNACPRTSGGIVCDSGVCHDINSDPNYCGFGAVICGPGKICHLGDCYSS